MFNDNAPGGNSMNPKPVYHQGMRQLQDARDTRRLADRLQEVTLARAFSDDDKAFIHSCAMVFVATADAQGQPDCSYKGGLPGFVRVVDDTQLIIPDYDGNGMYRTWGNVLVNPNVGLLFVDFETSSRMRVNGTARVCQEDPLLNTFPGATWLIRVTAEKIFPNCPRYMHRMKVLEHSEYAPRPNHPPPVPAWKEADAFREVLPQRDREPPEKA